MRDAKSTASKGIYAAQEQPRYLHIESSFLNPVIALGLAFELAWVIFAIGLGFPEFAASNISPLASPSAALPAGLIPLCFGGGLLVGSLVGMIAARTTALLLTQLDARSAALIAAAQLVLPAVYALGNLVALPPVAYASAAFIGGYAGLYLLAQWAEVMSAIWNYRLKRYTAYACLLAAVLAGFLASMAFPAKTAATFLLACASPLFVRFAARYADAGVRQKSNLSPYNQLLSANDYPIVIAFAALAGASAVALLSQGWQLAEIVGIVAASAVLGLAAGIAETAFVRRYLPFGRIQKPTLVILGIGVILLVILPGNLRAIAFVVVGSGLAYHLLSKFVTTPALASMMEIPVCELFYWSRFSFYLAALAGGIACYAAATLGSARMADWLLVAIVVVLAALLFVSPFNIKRVEDRKAAMPELPQDSAFDLAVFHVGKQYGLSAREVDVLALLGRGRNAAHIAQELVISPQTAKTHIKHIYRKTGVASQQQLIDLLGNAAK